MDLGAHLPVDLLAAPAVAQRDRDRALRLADWPTMCWSSRATISRGVIVVLRRAPAVRSSHRSLDRQVVVGVDADVGGDVQRRLDDLPGARARCSRPARARRRREGPPEPMATTPSSGSMTSPLPETSARSVLVGDEHQRLEAAQVRVGAPVLGHLDRRAREVARCFSSLPSKRSNSVNASAVPPAKPAITLSS